MRDVFIEHKTILTGLYYQHLNGPEYTFGTADKCVETTDWGSDNRQNTSTIDIVVFAGRSPREVMNYI